MKTDTSTLELPGLPVAKKHGRPKTGKTISNAERQKRYRQRHVSIATGNQIAATIRRLATQFDLPEHAVTKHLLRFALCNRNWSQTGFPMNQRNENSEGD